MLPRLFYMECIHRHAEGGYHEYIGEDHAQAVYPPEGKAISHEGELPERTIPEYALRYENEVYKRYCGQEEQIHLSPSAF